MEKKNSKIPKGQTEIVQSEDKQYHGQQQRTKDKHSTHNTSVYWKPKLEKHESYRNMEVIKNEIFNSCTFQAMHLPESQWDDSNSTDTEKLKAPAQHFKVPTIYWWPNLHKNYRLS